MQTFGASLQLLAAVTHVLVFLASSIINIVSGDSYSDDSVCQGGALICQNQGRCINDTTCLCYPGYTSSDCSQDITCRPISELLKNTQFVLNQGSAYNDYVTFTCKYGFQFPDVADVTSTTQRTVRCNIDGTWGPNFGDCKPLCPVIPIWQGYSVVDDSSGSSTAVQIAIQPRVEGTKLQYRCSGTYGKGVAAAFGMADTEVRYEFIDKDTGTKIAYCRNGQWIPPLVQCIDLLYYKAPSTATSTRSVLVGQIVALSLITAVYGNTVSRNAYTVTDTSQNMYR